MSDSATKRKANGPPDSDAGSRSAKRQKAAGAADGSSETAETTYERGQDFLRTIKASKDKTGRSIIDEFLTLPDAKEIPEYYQQIKLPLAVDTIEAKLKRRQYPNLTALESDFKRMVQNAKDFNDKRSLIFEDAERVRKGASNWFTRHNPAYNDRDYVAKPTPIPDETNGTPATPAPTKIKLTTKAAPVRTPAASATPAPAAKEEEEDDAEGEAYGEASVLPDFKGKSFQKAQEQLLDQLIHYTDPADESDQPLEIFTPFHFLPPRSLADYYEVIKHPVSLKAVEKHIIGKVGRLPPTGVSAYPTWDALEKELSYVWSNCREYNEDGSEMYNLAGEFEETCKSRIALARSQVPGPKGTTIKLNMSAAASAPSKNPTLKLKLGGSRPSPSPAPTAEKNSDRGTPGIVVDNDALKRQQDMVAASTNGRPASAAGRNPFGSSTRSGSGGTPIPGLARGASATSPPVQTNGVKAEGQSPALSAIRPTNTVPMSMPPPAGVNSRPVSGSPHPQTLSNGYGAVQPPIPQYQPPPAANTFVQSKLRPTGHSVKDSILPTLTITQHPSVRVSSGETIFTRTIKAHPRLIDQSVTYTVPPSKVMFQIIPYLPPSVTSRAYRIFVLVNGQRVSARVPPPGEESDRSKPVYEARLERGTVGRIEVEVLAEKAVPRTNGVTKGDAEGKEGKKKEDEVDRERVCVFVHVLRG